jgi:hypothetical protein
MEIQFTIKLSGSTNAAVLTKQSDDTALQAASLGSSANESTNKTNAMGIGGSGGDSLAPGSGGPGTGQVIVIGPIVINGGGETLVQNEAEKEAKKKESDAAQQSSL